MSRLGIDIDVCLANFSQAYATELTKYTGIKFPDFTHDTTPNTWYWEREGGVTKEQESWVWNNRILQKGSKFWENLNPLDEAIDTIKQLDKLSKTGHSIYYITHRMGDMAKRQTEKWLYMMGMDYGTVLISGNKLPLIIGLELDAFIDDKESTIKEVVDNPVGARIYIKDANYNKECKVGIRVKSVKQMLIKEGLWV